MCEDDVWFLQAADKPLAECWATFRFKPSVVFKGTFAVRKTPEAVISPCGGNWAWAVAECDQIWTLQ